jgi:hypothetical protein
MLGWSAALFAVLATPLALAVGHGGGRRSVEATASTLGPLPNHTCDALRAVADAGSDAYDAVMVSGPRVAWERQRGEIDAALARYEFTLQSARRQVPPVLRDTLGLAAQEAHRGRAELALARDHGHFMESAFLRVVNVFGAMIELRDHLGDACGDDFTFATGSLT